MTLLDFQSQMKRLRTRFSDKNFDEEFTTLIWRELHDCPIENFKKAVDVFIGSRGPNKPPMLADFRQIRLATENRKFQDDLRGAQNFIERKAPEEMREHSKKILSKEFGAVESVADALEIARLRIRAGEK